MLHFDNNNRKAKLPVELEVASSNADDVDPEEDFEATVDETVQKMVAAHEKLHANAALNITDAQARYKKDYDKKRNPTEVYV